MYLQSLELFGFKSFAQKTTLNFHRGVTAVVGPNGCGKSNVLDAIRWVLGEQSAKALRGGEMADVIFSGTDSRQPLGMAEVSLTFGECENQLGVEWNEVRLTRRVFRDGRSEYLLNKAPCRLRDIQQLFMDTGVGRSAYSIMEQGKLDQILSSRPEDRRAIFEEAAGITKFKSQRKEAMRKLDATEANLLRVTDIVKEVKRQIGSLQRQAGKARRYQALISDLRTLDTHFCHHQFSQLATSLTATTAEIERLRESHTAQQEQIESQETEISARRLELEMLEETLNTARQAVQDLKNQVSNSEHRITFNGERITEFNSLAERYEGDIAAAREKLQAQETQIENTDSELSEILQTLETEQTQLDERQMAVSEISGERKSAERDAQMAVSEISKYENRLSTLRGEIASAISSRDGSETRLAILAEELQKMSEAGENLSVQNSETAAELSQNIETLESRQNEAREAEALAKSIQSEVEEIDRELSVEQRKLTEKESKLDVLRQLNADGEGLSEGAQAVLRGLDNPDFFKPAIIGALATQIEVAPEFVVAIESALGRNLQAIMLKDTMVAESVVKTLATKKLGRAVIAIRDFLPQHSANELPALPEGASGWAADKVNANGETAAFTNQLLRGIAITADLETALRLKAQSPALGFVTLGGEFISREGIVHGGANRDDSSNSVLQRKNQINALEQETGVLRSSLANIQNRRDETFDRIESARSQLAETHSEIQQINLAVSTLRGRSQQIERELRDATKKAETLGWERDNIQQRHREASAKHGALEAEMNGCTARIADTQARQTEFQTVLETLRVRESQLTEDLNEMRIKVATEKQRHNSLQNQRQPMAARLAELGEIISQRQNDIDTYRQRAENLSGECEQIEEAIESLRAQAAEAETEVSQHSEARSAAAVGIEEFNSTLRILHRQLSESHDKRSKFEVKETQLQMRTESICEHVTRRYQIDIRKFEPDSYALITTLRELQKKNRVSAGNAENTDSANSENSGNPANDEATGKVANDDLAENPANSEPSLDQPAEQPVEQIDWDSIETLVGDFTKRVDSMGPVNLDAIQEYDELEERHQFLENQFNDLTSSKAELLDVIAKINVTSKTLFSETFEKIRVNFQTMFTELFGGGKANLVLTDESDPLESGIEIIAKPPGKQLQSISLLSGGEKTMTAVSLLFSIYMVKPSPFCVLDEMDAPLDESNIMRFVKILDRFIGQSQFVVITHNKRTISRADVLYGVTMEEQGISKLVSVRFAKRDETKPAHDVIGAENSEAIPGIAESLGKSGKLHSETVEASVS